MLNLLKTHFGFEQFLPWQEEIIRWVLAKQDALVLMTTGGGKSRCSQADKERHLRRILDLGGGRKRRF